jgi:hypothetical protein
MIKNQLVIYRTFATHQYIIDVHQIKETTRIPISTSVKAEHITSNYPFTISDHHILIEPQIQSISTSSKAIDETFVKDINRLHNIEIIIKYLNIKWKSVYNFFKNTNTLICYASIYNETGTNIYTNDVKVVFRSIDHEYDNTQEKNLTIDIPTFHTKNIIQFDLKDILDKPFILSDYSSVEMWRYIVKCKEIYRHNLKDIYQNHCDSFLMIDTPEILLPGHFEIYDRSDTNDILCLGSTNIKLYKKDQTLKIHFPKNRSIKLKNDSTKKSHSFFMNKVFHTFHTKIKKSIDGNAIIHFYIEKSGIKNPSKPPTLEEDEHYYWEVTSENQETIFELNFSIEQ